MLNQKNIEIKITMTTIKSYVSLEQSKVLAKILPPESADMYYFLDPTPAGNIYHLVVQRIDFGVRTREPEYDKGDIPAWSLTPLLNVLPNDENISTNLSKGGYRLSTLEYDADSWFVDYEDETNSLNNCITSADNPIDACYEMIVKLYKLNLL